MKVLSERLVMNPISEDDWPLFYELHTTSEVISLCFDEPERAEIEAKFQSRLNSWSPGSSHWLCLVVSESDTGGRVGITGLCVQDDVAEVGFMFLPKYHGLGYGTESLKALIKHSRKQFGVENFNAVVTEGNAGSERVLLKSGFRLHKIVPDAHEIGGQLYADHIYQLGNVAV